MSVLFEMVNNSSANDAVDVAQRFGGFPRAISYKMKVVGHYYISVNRKTGRLSGLIERIARYDFDGARAKYRKTVFSYRSDVESRIVA